jgi:hypothetical protein
MKSRIFRVVSFALVSFGLLPWSLLGADKASEPTTSPPPEEAAVKPKLPYGAEDIVKLSTARVHEDVIVNYIQTSGTIYNLGPSEIVRLRDEGVSDRVINAMMDQRKILAPSSVQPSVAQTPAPAPAVSPAPAPAVTTVYVAATPQAVAQPQPATPASTVHVIPYPAARAAYYGPPPYYYRPPDYGWYYRPVYPRVAFGFGFGGYRCW